MPIDAIDAPAQVLGIYDNEDGAPTGACCVSSGCHNISELGCGNLGGNWLGVGGACNDCPASCAGDTDGNGVVNIEDLLNMLGSWGACP